jgi:putative oxidoreductase
LVRARLVLSQIMSGILHLIRRGYELLVTVANLLQAPLLLALRIYFFWQLFEAGKGKLLNLGKIIGFFTSLGIPAPALNAYFVSCLECFGGLLLIIGLASRPIALMVSVSMFVAYWTADHEALTSVINDPDKFTKADPFPYLLTALIVLAFGPGLLSVDALLKRVVGQIDFPRPGRSTGVSSRQKARNRL